MNQTVRTVTNVAMPFSYTPLDTRVHMAELVTVTLKIVTVDGDSKWCQWFVNVSQAPLFHHFVNIEKSSTNPYANSCMNDIQFDSEDFSPLANYTVIML